MSTLRTAYQQWGQGDFPGAPVVEILCSQRRGPGSNLSIPVIANGDIIDGETAVKCLRRTGADGVMIGRASFGDPWVFTEVKAALEGAPAPERLPLKERIAVAVRQFELSEQDHGEHIACLEARKHFAWYLRGVRNASFYKNQISSMNTMEDIYRIAKEIVRDLQ